MAGEVPGREGEAVLELPVEAVGLVDVSRPVGPTTWCRPATTKRLMSPCADGPRWQATYAGGQDEQHDRRDRGSVAPGGPSPSDCSGRSGGGNPGATASAVRS